MKQYYTDAVKRLLSLPISEDGTQFDGSGAMLHLTHGARFGIFCDETSGMLITAVSDPSLYEDLDAHIDGSVIPGAMSLRGVAPTLPRSVTPVLSADRENGVLSALIEQGGITYRQTVFTFDGGIAVLICDIDRVGSGEEEDDMPVFESGVFRCLCHPDRMKVYKNTTTHGGLILRTLMDDVKVNRHIRPGEKGANLFTATLQTSPLMPCMAYEITTVGMGFGCQIMANNHSCQAILLSGGDILSFDPVSGKLSRF